MHKNAKVMMLVVPFVLFLSVKCAAADDITAINDLIEQSITLDNRAVTVQGEVIGEPLERGEYAWINISDTTNATGIWVKRSDAERIAFYGDYKHKGDIVKITGVFHKACSAHGGDVDIHCNVFKITETGHNVTYGLSGIKITATVLLMAAATLTGTIYLRLSGKYGSKRNNWLQKILKKKTV